MPEKSLKYSELRALEEMRELDIEFYKWKNKQISNIYADIIPFYPATDIEKMVFNYLLRLGVNFQFQYRLRDFPETFFPEDIWIPDFVLPDYNIVIETFGYYWHSIPRRVENDQVKRLYYLALGYAVVENGNTLYPSSTNWNGGKLIIWWDYEIYADLGALIARDCPEILIKKAPTELPQVPEIRKIEAIQKAEFQKAAAITKRIVPKFKPLKPLSFKLRRYGRRGYQIPESIL